MGRDTFLVHHKYKKRFQRWGAEKTYAILMAMFDYAESGTVDLPEEYYDAFEPIKDDLDAMREAYENRCRVNAENGAKGGRPRKTEKTDSVIEKPNKAYSESESDSDLKKDISKDISKKRVFQKPTVEEVREYCCDRKNSVDPQRFVDYYESNGWMIGKNKMKDWKAAVRTWERNNFPQTEKRKVSAYIEREVKAKPRFGMEYLYDR